MNDIKTFTEYNNDYLCNENLSINQYQYMVKSVLKEIGVQLYFAATFGTALTVLIPMVNNIMIKEQVDISTKDIILITIFVISVLCKESKEKVAIIYNKIKEKNIDENILDKIVNVFRNLNTIFMEIALLLGKTVEKFSDMLVYTSVFVPFISIISDVIDNNQIDMSLLYQSVDVFKITLGSIAIKLLMNKIIRKLNIMLSDTNKIQNVENIKPLLADQELKPKMYKKVNYFAK